jgi:TnpA family transposase
VTGVAAYFNPSNAISEQYREGLVARTAMADYYENERVWGMATISSVTLSSAS